MSHSLRHCDVDGHRIAVLANETGGDEPPLILIHGVLLSVNIWPPLLPEWLRDRRWYAVGLPAHHPSVPPPDFCDRPMPEQLFGVGLASVVTRIAGDQRVDLMGHSTGGYASLAIAAHIPEQVRSVCCVSGFAQGRWLGLIGLMQTIAAAGRFGRIAFPVSLAAMSVHPLVTRLSALAATTRPRAFWDDPRMKQALAAAVADLRQTDRTALRHFFAEIRGHDISAALPRIQAPTLVVHGSRDPIVPFDQARLIKQRVPGAELAPLSEIGHMPFAEAADEFDAILKQWFKA